MKTKFTKLMAAIILLSAPLATAANTWTTERSVKVSKENKKAVVLRLGNLADQTEISIKDQDGQVLFEDETGEEQYSKTFDLKSLKEGEVYLEIENESRLEIVPIEVTSSSATIKRSAEIVIEKPIVKMKDDQAKVFFGNNDAEMQVTLFDIHQDIAFRETVTDGTGSRTYDMSKLGEGNYKLKFTAKGRSFYHTIILN